MSPITKVERERREVLFARGLKECSSPECVVPYPLEWFGPNPRAYRGLHGKCIPCRRDERLEDQRRNPEKANAKAKRWRERHPERAAAIAKKHRDSHVYEEKLRSGRKRAADLGLPAADIAVDELLTDLVRRGVDPDRDAFTGEVLQSDWELDHLVPLSHPQSPGHVVWNLLPVNRSTNQAKWKRTWLDYLADRAEQGWRGEVA